MCSHPITIGLDDIFNKLKFNKEYYNLYNDILYGKCKLTDDKFIFIIIQCSLQLNFFGYFEDLYIDVIKRKQEYRNQIILNFKTSYIIKDSFFYSLLKNINLIKKKPDERIIYFSRIISLFDFDEYIDNYFMLKDEYKKELFLKICNDIYVNEIYKKFNFKFINNSILGEDKIHPM